MNEVSNWLRSLASETSTVSNKMNEKSNSKEANCEPVSNWRRSHASETSTVAYLFAPSLPNNCLQTPRRQLILCGGHKKHHGRCNQTSIDHKTSTNTSDDGDGDRGAWIKGCWGTAVVNMERIPWLMGWNVLQRREMRPVQQACAWIFLARNEFSERYCNSFF